MNSVIVVGGGAIGLFSALELLRSGLEVTVIDRQQFGRESSWAGGGIISPLYPWRYPDPITDLARLSQHIYPGLLGELQQATGVDPQLIGNGMLVLGDYSDERPLAWAERQAIDMQPVDREAIAALAPEVSPQYSTGFWFPRIQQARNPRLVKLLKSYLATQPVTLLENQAVTGLLQASGRVSGVQTDSGKYYADAVVIAGGAWTSELLQNHPLAVAIKPIRGQMLLLKGEPGCVKRITLSSDRYLIPRSDGRILVGSTTEDAGFDKSISDDTRQQLWQYAIDTVPSLQQYPVEHHWSGLRPASDDGIPLITPHPQLQGLFINAGHYRNGLVMAPASARLLADLITCREPCLNPAPYQISDARHSHPEPIDRLSLQN